MQIRLLNPNDYKSPEEWVEWIARLSRNNQDQTGKDTLGFLERLIKAEHFSIFEHATFRVHAPEERSELLDWLYENPTIPFVWKRNGGMILGVNLRHCLEPVGHPTRLRHFVLSAVSSLVPGLLPSMSAPLFCRVSPGHISPGEDEMLTGLGKSKDVQTRCDKVTYASFLIEGISRACEVQFVRHRVLSFTVQSGRAVDLSDVDFVFPPGTYEESEMLSEDPEDELFKAPTRALVRSNLWHEYTCLRARGIKRENARFFLPMGQATRMVVTGSLHHWKLFLKERLAPAAMWEIKQVAGEIKEALNL